MMRAPPGTGGVRRELHGSLRPPAQNPQQVRPGRLRLPLLWGVVSRTASSRKPFQKSFAKDGQFFGDGQADLILEYVVLACRDLFEQALVDGD